MNNVNSQRRVLAALASRARLTLLVPASLTLALCLIFPLVCVSDQADRQLTITLERVPAPSGQDTLTLKATVKNVSKHQVLIAVWDPLEDYSLTVTDPTGAPVPLSRRGKEFFSKDRVRYRTANVIVTLQPGETRVDVWAIDDFFEFARPGRYHITVRRDFEAAHEADSSNTVDVALR